MDQFNGETTEKIDPFNQGEVKTYDEKNIDLGKTRRSQSNIVKSLEGTYGPILAAIMFPKLFANGVISGLTTMGGGYIGGKAVDKLSESLTGNDFETLIAKNTPLSPGLAEWLNPGNVVGGYTGPRTAVAGDIALTAVTGKSRNFMKPLVKTYVGNSYYDRVRPFGYGNTSSDPHAIPVSKEGLDIVKDFVTPLFMRKDVTKPDYMPSWIYDKNNPSIAEVFRNDAHRLSMNLPARQELLPDGKYHSLYIKKDDGTYDVDLDYINYVKTHYTNHDGLISEQMLTKDGFPDKVNYISGDPNTGSVVANDLITLNGGFGSYSFDTNPLNLYIVNKSKYPDVNPDDIPNFITDGDVTFTDKWDIQPFSDWRSASKKLTDWTTYLENKDIPFLSKLANNIKLFEVVDGLGGTPFVQKSKLPNKRIYWYNNKNNYNNYVKSNSKQAGNQFK